MRFVLVTCLMSILFMKIKKSNQEVILEWDYEDQYCIIHSQTISREKDWLGQTHQMPMPLTICEAEIFMARLKELRES